MNTNLRLPDMVLVINFNNSVKSHHKHLNFRLVVTNKVFSLRMHFVFVLCVVLIVCCETSAVEFSSNDDNFPFEDVIDKDEVEIIALHIHCHSKDCHAACQNHGFTPVFGSQCQQADQCKCRGRRHRRTHFNDIFAK